MARSLNLREEAFCIAVVNNGGDKVAAYKTAGYSTKLNPNAMSVQADKLFNKPKLSLRIQELQVEADKVAKESFRISVEQRLDWIKQVAEAGLHQHKDEADKLLRYENLAATNKAVEILNNMLGINEDDDDKGDPLTITFEVSAPVKDVKITNAKTE